MSLADELKNAKADEEKRKKDEGDKTYCAMVSYFIGAMENECRKAAKRDSHIARFDCTTKLYGMISTLRDGEQIDVEYKDFGGEYRPGPYKRDSMLSLGHSDLEYLVNNFEFCSNPGLGTFKKIVAMDDEFEARITSQIEGYFNKEGLSVEVTKKRIPLYEIDFVDLPDEDEGLGMSLIRTLTGVSKPTEKRVKKESSHVWHVTYKLSW